MVAYDELGILSSFRCETPAGEVTTECDGWTCFFGSGCAYGESCVDNKLAPGAAPAGTLSTAQGGTCVSNAAAEAVYGWSVSDLMQLCSSNVPDGYECEAGWRPGEQYFIERVVRAAGSCGNGVCDFPYLETTATCPTDCACGDGHCDLSEVGSCVADCGICADDGCEQPVMPLEWSTLSACGDGVCQCDGVIPEGVRNCPHDCATATDTDSDGTPDRCDGCPSDSAKVEPGLCGCGQSEVDTDGDGLADCIDNCPLAVNDDQGDHDLDGRGDVCDADADGDTVADDGDLCPWSVLNDPPDEWKKNRYAVDAQGWFVDVTGMPSGFTIAATFGCGEDQIIQMLGLGNAHERFGITRSALIAFIEAFGP